MNPLLALWNVAEKRQDEIGIVRSLVSNDFHRIADPTLAYSGRRVRKA